MKKEHWLYIIIAVLVIWIIASYATAPKTEAPVTDEEGATISEITTDIEANLINNQLAMSGNVESVAVVGTIAGPNKGVVTNVAPTDSKIVTSNQVAGGMVKIDSVSLTFNGWVVVNESDASGNPGSILGAQRFDMGAYSGGQVELLRPTVTGGKYLIMLHQDNGDKIFDHKLDMPFAENATHVTATFLAQ